MDADVRWLQDIAIVLLISNNLEKKKNTIMGATGTRGKKGLNSITLPKRSPEYFPSYWTNPYTLLVNYPVNVYNFPATCFGPSRPLSDSTTNITSHADAILHTVTTLVHLITKLVYNTLWLNTL